MNDIPFEKGASYSSLEICQICGGGSIVPFLLQVEGAVVAGRFDPKLNPGFAGNGPGEVYVGHGRQRRAKTHAALEQAEGFHAFIKRGNKDHEYVGVYEAYGFDRSPERVAMAEAHSDRPGGIAGILKLRPISTSRVKTLCRHPAAG